MTGITAEYQAALERLPVALRARDRDTLFEILKVLTRTPHDMAFTLHAVAVATAVLIRGLTTRTGFSFMVLKPGADESDPAVAAARILTAAMNRDEESVTAHVHVVAPDPVVSGQVLLALLHLFGSAIDLTLDRHAERN